ncbi:hypothetical protein [Christiangramia sp. SM2212]|uniref:Uncharacterized protein n=1 Tax=Christiangramia sediminicola TaxID=3073267 RepID=A0ABU1EM72_9FLAO|nr:hypothetical protein [Christiangramia sp. SM2212]MDR5589486.1 hypothetical protein [Christiangramia sp. SM2212]
MYRIKSEDEKRLMLRSFYANIYQQKLDFLKDIEENIDRLKKEISPLLDPKTLSFYRRKKCELSQFYLKYKLKYKFADIHRREWKAFKKYDKYLPKTNHAIIRELILEHKHKIKNNLTNMNNSGVMKYPVA